MKSARLACGSSGKANRCCEKEGDEEHRKPRQIVAVRKRETKSIEKDREGGRRRGKEKKRPGERKKET